MEAFMVYAWKDFYPDVAHDQVKGLFFDEKKAKALVVELKASGKYDHVKSIDVDIVE